MSFTSVMTEMTSEEILRKVAAGELTPEQALPLLEAARPEAPSSPPATPTEVPAAETPVWGTPPGPSPAPTSGEGPRLVGPRRRTRPQRGAFSR